MFTCCDRPAAMGAMHASHGWGRKATPWTDCERAMRGQQADMSQTGSYAQDPAADFRHRSPRSRGRAPPDYEDTDDAVAQW